MQDVVQSAYTESLYMLLREISLLGAARAGCCRYNYVLLDDGWPACDEWEKPSEPEASGCKNPAPRLDNGDVVVDANKFPPSRPDMNDGIKVVADYLHAKGLKMGIYTAPHGLTCGGYWGMLGHEATDSAMYARWGIVRQFTPTSRQTSL